MQQTDMYSSKKLVESLKSVATTEDAHALLEAAFQESGSFSKIAHLPDEFLQKAEQEALLLFSQQNYQEARAFFQFLATARPGIELYWIYLGSSCMKLNLHEDALRAYGIATTVDPQDPKPYFFSAYSYGKLQQQDEAKLCLHQVIDLCSGKTEWQKLEEEAIHFLHQITERDDS